MCYPLPGPRCSPEARKELDAALTSGDKQAIKVAREQYFLTPRGIKALRETGQEAKAERYKRRRKALIAQVKADQAKQPKLRVAIDLDNTTADFTAGFRDFATKMHGLSPEEAAKRFPEPTAYQYVASGWFKSGGEFMEAFKAAEADGVYRKMVAYKAAAETLHKLVRSGKVEIHVVTARDKAWSADTLAWLKANHIPFSSVTHTDAKEKTDMDIYIDDADYQLQKLRDAGKEVIAFDQLYNASMTDLPRVKSWEEIPAVVRVLRRKVEKKRAAQQTIAPAQAG